MKNEVKIGEIVHSTQGRDKNEIYVVVALEGNFAFLCNGTTKLLVNPKKKNKLHLKTTPVVITEIAQKLEQKRQINDQMIYHSIHEYKKGNKGEIEHGN